MVRDYEQRFIAQTQSLHLHGGGDHFKGLSGSNLVGEKRIPSVYDAGNGVFLMLPEYDFRVHPGEYQVAPVVLAGPGGVHLLVILTDQLLPALRVLPDPSLKLLPEKVLFLGGKGGFLDVQDALYISGFLLNIVIDSDVL